MKEIVKANKMIDICKDITRVLEMYVKNNPEQNIEVNINDEYGTNTIIIDILGQGHKLNRPINYLE